MVSNLDIFVYMFQLIQIVQLLHVLTKMMMNFILNWMYFMSFKKDERMVLWIQRKELALLFRHITK